MRERIKIYEMYNKKFYNVKSEFLNLIRDIQYLLYYQNIFDNKNTPNS